MYQTAKDQGLCLQEVADVKQKLTASFDWVPTMEPYKLIRQALYSVLGNLCRNPVTL